MSKQFEMPLSNSCHVCGAPLKAGDLVFAENEDEVLSGKAVCPACAVSVPEESMPVVVRLEEPEPVVEEESEPEPVEGAPAKKVTPYQPRKPKVVTEE